MKTTDVRVRRAIAAVAAGRAVVVVDDTARDRDAHLVFAADAATPTLMAFTVRHTSGYVRAALPDSECERLGLPPMCGRANDRAAAAHRVTVDWSGTGTGISATDRARTIAALATASSRAADFRRPGHVVPMQAAEHGVLGRPGVAEAAVDLAGLAGRRQAGVFCEIVSRLNPTGMAGGAESAQFALEHGLAVVTIGELVAYRRRTEPQVVRVAETAMGTAGGTHRVVGFRDTDNGEHLVVIVGATDSREPVPLHVHMECVAGDVFGSTFCRCGLELDNALAAMTAAGSGVIVYLRPPGPVNSCSRRGPGEGPMPDTVAWILRDLGIYSVRVTEEAPGFGLVMFGAIREHRSRPTTQRAQWPEAG